LSITGQHMVLLNLTLQFLPLKQRLALLCAVLEKKAGMDLYGCDIFLNIAGGIRIEEPALDLGVISALASSMLERPIPSATVLCGELSLGGAIVADEWVSSHESYGRNR